MRRCVQVAVGLIAVLSVSSELCAEDRGSASWRSVMQEFASVFRGLEQASNAGEAAKSPQYARKLRIHANALQKSGSDDSQAQGDIDSHRERMLEIIAFLESDKLDPTKLAQATNELRGTCVSCHIKFRGEGEERGFYPAHKNTIVVEVRVTRKDGTARDDRSDVVVFIDGMKNPVPYTPLSPPKMSQANRRFTPRVLPIVGGTTVEFPNDDTIFHNVFSLSKARRFDLDVYKPGETKSVHFQKPGLVKVYCNIHPGLVSSVLALANPHFDVTNHAGLCVITGIPDGEYSLRSWQEFGGDTGQKVTLSGDAVSHVSLEIKETKRSLRHKNKFGKSYRKKY